jgi:DNA-binding response OmpR family regulator
MKPDELLPAVLIVDDDEDDVALLVRQLKAAGVRNPLLHFRTGGDAYVFLRQFCEGRKTHVRLPVLMFLDVNMEELSGFDVLLWARRQAELEGMKIYMLSGANEEHDAQIAAQLGADEYLQKFPGPVALQELLSRVGALPMR